LNFISQTYTRCVCQSNTVKSIAPQHKHNKKRYFIASDK